MELRDNDYRREEISDSSLDRAHSIGDFEDDLDKISIDHKEQQKLLCPWEKSGGPDPNYEDKKSATWQSDYEDNSQSEINTDELKNFFPDEYKMIENCEDSLQRISIKQMVKMNIKQQEKDYEREKSSSVFSSSEAALEPNPSNEIIKVHDNDAEEREEFSITTPRNELQSSIEKQERLGAIGEKTELQHTFEDGDFSESLINSQFFEKEYNSKENVSNSDNYTSSN